MGKEKRKIKGMIFGLIFLLSIVGLGKAETSCYLYKESMLYCLDLEKEEALNDCLAYEDCNFRDVFFEGKSCEDSASFPECEEVFCKSSCDYEFLGKCLGGKVPEGEEGEWCSPGCCRFEYYDKEFCGFRESKWLCEREAENKEARFFNFDINLNKEECEHFCSQAVILGKKVTEGLVMEEVRREEVIPEITEEINGEETAEEILLEEEKPLEAEEKASLLDQREEEELLQEEEKKSEEMVWLWFILVLILLLVVFYLAYQLHRLKRKKVILREPKEEKKEKEKKEKKLRFFFNRKAIREGEERLKKLRAERERKRKEKEREELFKLFGLKEEKEKEKKFSYVGLLGKIAEAHELKKRRGKVEEDIFREIEALTKREEKHKTEEAAKDVFERLKKIIAKQG